MAKRKMLVIDEVIGRMENIDLMCLSQDRNSMFVVEPQCLSICLLLPHPLYYMTHVLQRCICMYDSYNCMWEVNEKHPVHVFRVASHFVFKES